MAENDPEQGYQDVPRPWWIVKSTDHWRGTGLTTVAPFWRLIHIRNAWSSLRLWWAVKRGY